MSADNNDSKSIGSSSLCDSSLIEDEDFQLVNGSRKSSRRSSCASLGTASQTGGSQAELFAADCQSEPTSGDEGKNDDVNQEAQNENESDPGVMDILYGEEAQNSAMRNLIVFSIIMFTVPMIVVYASYVYFIEHLHWPRNEAALYAGVLGIASVIIVVVVFLWVAYREVVNDEERIANYKQSKKDD